MKEKKWKDCPICGAKGSMQFRKNVSHTFKSKSYPSVKISGLSKYQCKECRDAIYTIASENKIQAAMVAHKAKHDAKTTFVSEVLPVSKASQILKMTRQGVLKLMKTGKLEYVFLEDKRLPKKRAVLEYGK